MKLTILLLVLLPLVSSSSPTPAPLNKGVVKDAGLSLVVKELVYRMHRLETKQACARASVALDLPDTFFINETTTFNVLARDCAGYDLSTGGDNVTATLTSVDYPKCASPNTSVVDNEDGSYQVICAPQCTGTNLLTISVDGKPIKGYPHTIAVIPNYIRYKRKMTITQIRGPNFVDIADNGDAYITGYTDNKVHHFNKHGQVIDTWKVPGGYPHGIVLHGSNVYVADHTHTKIYNYTTSGKLMGAVFNSYDFYDLAVGPDGRLYAAYLGGDSVQVFNIHDGAFFHAIPTPDPLGLAFNNDGNIHVNRAGYNAVYVRNRSGSLLRSYTLTSNTRSYGMLIDRAGNFLTSSGATSPGDVVITDKSNSLIQKLRGMSGSTDVAMAPNGDLWVCDRSGNKVVVFAY